MKVSTKNVFRSTQSMVAETLSDGDTSSRLQTSQYSSRGHMVSFLIIYLERITIFIELDLRISVSGKRMFGVGLELGHDKMEPTVFMCYELCLDDAATVLKDNSRIPWPLCF